MSFRRKSSQICLLVFPLDVDKSREVIAFARSLGIDVVGASSVMSEAEAERYQVSSFRWLPFITEAGFESAFLALLEEKGITHAYIPHGVIWTQLKKNCVTEPDRYRFHLFQTSPYEEDWLRLLPSQIWADQVLANNFVETLHLPGEIRRQAPLRRGQLISLHRQFICIPGQSDEEKLMALANIARALPQGDMVEVGSFQGRSAFAIGWLARHYRIGNLVCVDPWDNEKIVDQGEKARLASQELQQGRDLIDLEKIFQGFISAVSLLDNVGYIRDISEVAIGVYQDAVARSYLEANDLDALPLTGGIALLHIDGNHRYDFVRQDVDLWLPHVIPGGWLLLDDYVWAFGDGPKRVGDELLNTAGFDVAFTASDTLFLRKRVA